MGGRANAKSGTAPPRGISNREPPSREEFGSERGKIQLKSRSEQMSQGANAEAIFERGGEAQQRTLPPQTDPFGGARPREERFKPTRADTDHNLATLRNEAVQTHFIPCSQKEGGIQGLMSVQTLPLFFNSVLHLCFQRYVQYV